ncbi:unnamed protein product [Toxocara canis]|uniref:tRNA (uracil-O(2)-)-methyltransferase n=1 Tax=Toxocara canis TaxID=6265 RepID=A0A3P7I748_TOXCA|nr:unnamed protein product [Toxocara canis]
MQLIELWRDHCNAINRRLFGIKLLKANDENYADVLSMLKLSPIHGLEVRKFIPKSDLFSNRAYEASAFTGEFQVDFWPCVLDEKRHPHVPFRYQLQLRDVSSDDNTLTCELQAFGNAGEQEISWMRDFAFPGLLRWLKNINLDGTCVKSHRLIGIDEFTQTYLGLKENLGREIASKWRERTDPQKFVFEDCAIAAYLILSFIFLCNYGFFLLQLSVYVADKLLLYIELWRSQKMRPHCFCDVGCGNGLLVYLLCSQMFHGYGVDIRRRNIWDDFRGTDLREQSLNPEKDLLEGTDFLIGNHSDELTPWIPVLAARIPSTKRRCIIGRIPDGGLPPDTEQVRNCSQLPNNLRQALTLRVFNYLLSLGTNEASEWRRGDSVPLSRVIELLSTAEKEQLKDSNGGLQTFLKNQHQVFKVMQGRVSIRDWAVEGKRRVEGKTKTTACWFKLHHPDGCPLSDDLCSFAH